MSTSEFQFDAKQQYQLDAIQSVVDLFDGQAKDVERLFTSLWSAPKEASHPKLETPTSWKDQGKEDRMKKSKFSQEQVVRILQEADSGKGVVRPQ